MFKKLFGIKAKSSEGKKSNVSSEPSSNKDDLDELIEKSTIQIMTHQLFMHHIQSNLEFKPNDQNWKNQEIYFWNADEKFEKKSLPPEFKSYEEHYFIVNEIPKELQLNSGSVMPWFGMEGNGTKFFFSLKNAEIPLRELAKKRVIQYVEISELSAENAAILKDRENYFWLMNTKVIEYENNSFQHKGKAISISHAFKIGGLQIIGIKDSKKSS